MHVDSRLLADVGQLFSKATVSRTLREIDRNIASKVSNSQTSQYGGTPLSMPLESSSKF